MSDLLKTIFAIVSLLAFIEKTSGKEYKINFDKYPSIRDCGYPYEYHYVVTSDGYIVTVLRVQNVNNFYNNVAIFVPGYACTASVWVNFGPEKSLPCILSNEGYDIWLVNYRGSTWSRNHTFLDPDVDKKQFWSYSLDEIGYYDIPAVIDYVLSITNQTSVHFIGHSLGAPIFLMMAADRQEYANKVKLAVLLTPAAYMDNAVNPIMSLIYQSKALIESITTKYDVYELLTRSEGVVTIIQGVCCEESPFQSLCIFILMSLGGFTPHQVNRTLFPLITTNVPGGASVNMLHHSVQLTNNKLEKLDYGTEDNIKKYGSAKPPQYDISKISTPIALYYGDKDFLVDYKNVDILSRQLPNVVVKKLLKGFNHIDVIFGNEAPMVFKDVITTMNRFN